MEIILLGCQRRHVLCFSLRNKRSARGTSPALTGSGGDFPVTETPRPSPRPIINNVLLSLLLGSFRLFCET